LGYKSRHVAKLSNIPLLGRTALISRVQQIASQASPNARFPRLIAFLQFWKWLLPYLRNFVHKDTPYRTYPMGKGIFAIEAPSGSKSLTIAVAADWGTGTLEAESVAANMKACSPHYTAHLGDVYYMGEGSEIRENCLGKKTKHYTGVHWPMDFLLGSFALMGNHEMYSGGEGYFEDFLPKLGLFNANGAVSERQSGSYFCLETENWLVFGLDTGYHSAGMPIFTSVPGINKIPVLNVDARFDNKMMAWLTQTVNLLKAKGSGNKSVLLLTHHQPISSFEHAFTKPVKQLAKLGFLNGQEFVWLYGHEHRLTIYEKQALANTLSVYPRCIGHGGMPVEVTELTRPDPDVAYYDPRKHPIDESHPNTLVGYNGHVVLIFRGAKLTIEYRDILGNDLLFEETFTSNGSGGLQHSPFKPSSSPLSSGSKIN
jgi:Calcineurin-like phosphoesterase